MGRGFSSSVSVAACLAVMLASPLRARQNLQAYLDSLTTGRRGSAIIINPATGEILAAWNLRAATRSSYPPGSTAKIVAATAALEEGVIAPRDRLVCRRIPPLLGAAYHCVHPPSPDGFTLAAALADSCNYFFTVLSLRLNPEALLHWYSVFGFGSAVELDGRRTGAGAVHMAKGTRGKALEALGEREVVSTPAQVLEAYALIANRGAAWGLRHGRARRAKSTEPYRRVSLKAAAYSALMSGLEGCVKFGTCQEAAVPGVEVAGKTGTSSTLDGSGATHAWFVGFAPADHPEIEVVVFLERGTGAHDAAPLAGKLLRYYFAGKEPSRSSSAHSAGERRSGNVHH